MAKRKKNLSPMYQPWVDARKRFHLSHAHIQMARELGMNPKKLGGKANHKQVRGAPQRVSTYDLQLGTGARTSRSSACCVNMPDGCGPSGLNSMSSKTTGCCRIS